MSVAVKRSRIETRSTQPAAHPAAGPGTDPEADLGRLRDEMERIDAAVVEAVARRLEIARRIG